MTFRTIRQKLRATRREKYRNDHLVPLDGGCLKAALQDDGGSLAQVAGRVRARGARCTKQDLHHLARRGRRCRASLRRALAAVLTVSEQWLAGGPLPVEVWGAGDAPRGFPPLPVARAGEPLPATAAAQRGASSAPRALLAERRFTERCYVALKRDFPDPKDEGAVLTRLSDLVSLINPHKARNLILGAARGAERAGWELSDAEVNRLVPRLVEVWDAILTPWFSNRVPLDYEWLTTMNDGVSKSRH